MGECGRCPNAPPCAGLEACDECIAHDIVELIKNLLRLGEITLSPAAEELSFGDFVCECHRSVSARPAMQHRLHASSRMNAAAIAPQIHRKAVMPSVSPGGSPR